MKERPWSHTSRKTAFASSVISQKSSSISGFTPSTEFFTITERAGASATQRVCGTKALTAPAASRRRAMKRDMAAGTGGMLCEF